jgi:hypothetical protein
VLPIRRYALIALSVLAFMLLFAYFSDERNMDFQFSGVVHDVKTSSNGYIFYIDTADESIRCYSSECPDDLGYYAVRGTFSDDGGIFFVEGWLDIDIYDDHD